LSLTALVINRPIATLTITGLVLLIGLVSLLNTPLDLLPEINPPLLAVVTVFPGASPQEILSLVTEPIEEQASAVGGLANLISHSQENLSLVLLKFHWGSNLERKREELGVRLDLLSLPEGVKRPLILKFDPTLLPMMEVAASGGSDPAALTALLNRRVKPRLEKIDGVAAVEVQGGVKEKLFISLDPERMKEQGISFDQVAAVLRASLLDLPAGIREIDQRQIRLRFLGRDGGAAGLEDLVVGFRVDRAGLENLVGESLHVDLNRSLEQIFKAASLKEIPLRPLYLDPAGEGQIEIPDLAAWLSRLQEEVKQGLGEISREMESSLAGLASALLAASPERGGMLPDAESAPLVPIPIKAIGTVEKSLSGGGTLHRINGKPVVSLVIQKEGDANTVAVSRRVRAELEAIAAESTGPEKLHFHSIFDQAVDIESALGDLAWALLGGSFLAVAVLLLFLRSWRAIAIIGLAIPAAVLATFALLYFTGLTLNVMTLGALALAAGMLVDNAIVVSENIYRHYERGAAPAAAAVRGSGEVAGAVFASTATTVAVFFPVVFIGGLAGELFRDFALALSCALFASLAIALTVVPLLASRFLAAGGKKAAVRSGQGLYRRVLERCVDRPWTATAAGMAFILLGLLLFPALEQDLFPSPDEGSFAIEITLPPGSTLEQTASCVEAVEKILAGQEGVASFASRIGEQAFFGLPLEGGGANRAEIKVFVEPQRKRECAAIAAAVQEKAAAIGDAASFSFGRISLLDLSGLETSLELTVSGEDPDKVREIAQELSGKLAALPEITGAQSLMEEGRPEIQLHLDQQAALRKGVTLYQVAMVVRQALEGTPVARLEEEEGGQELVLRYREDAVSSINDLEKIGFHTPSGAFFRLGEVARLAAGWGPAGITRENGEAVGMVQASYRSNLGSTSRRAMEIAAAMELPPGYAIRTSGTAALMDEVFGDLELVLLLALLLVYLVMAAQFESLLHPLIIILAVPLAFTGGIAALLLTGKSVSVPALIGAVVLSGVLVNSGIIMIDLINQNRRSGSLPLREAIIEGAAARLRPILMTTITTVLGLFPLALGLGEGSQLQAPMAIVMIGGQVAGTILLLAVIPALYRLASLPRGCGS